MAPKVVSVPLAFGRRDRVDARHAPFGVLKTAVNARMRKDGRIAVRGGYRPLEMTTAAGTLQVWDLFEFHGRLCALGDDRGSPFAARDLFEYVGQPGAAWRATDRFGGRIAINPIANLREVAGIGQPEGGVGSYAVAAGAGHVCLVYQTVDSGRLYALIVDAATNQTVHYEDLVSVGGPMAAGGQLLARAIFRRGAFYVASALTGRGDVTIARYTLGQSPRFEAFAVVTGNFTEIAALDLSHFTGTFEPWHELASDRVAIAYRRAGSSTVEARVYRTSDATLEASGSFTEASANQISIASGFGGLAVLVTTPTAAVLRVAGIVGGALNFIGGSVVVAAGAASAFVTWQPRLGTDPDTYATVSNVGADVWIRHYQASNLALVSTQTLRSARATGRPLSAAIWSDAKDPRAVLVPAIVAPKLATSLDQATNALFFVTPDVAHVVFRDYVSALGAAAPSTGLALDLETRQVAWPSLRDPGVSSLGMPTVTLADVGDRMSAARQSVSFGRLRYFAGGAPAVYDGRSIGELGFGEAPGVVNLTAGSSGSTKPAVITGTTQYRGQFVLIGGVFRLYVSIDDGTPETDPIVLSPTISASTGMFFTSLALIAAHLNAQPEFAAHVTASVWKNRLRLTTVATGAHVSIAVLSGEQSVKSNFGFPIGEPAHGTSKLYPGATYHYVVHWETVLADGSVMLSPPSAGGGPGSKLAEAATITLEQGQDQVTIEATTPHTVRVALGDALFGAHVSVVVSRTEWDPVLQAPVGIYRRVAVAPARGGMNNYGKTISIVDAVPDADMAANEVLYTQGAQSAYGGRLEVTAPGPCRFIAATESRLLLGGLLRENLVQISFEAAPNEVFGFNNLGPFFAAVPEPVRAVRALDGVRFVFTERKLLAIQGDGPDDIGGGALAAPVEMPTPGGLVGARSLALADDGLWFQLDEDKLYRIPRGGGAPEWAGIDVEDHLRTHPLIVGAAHHRADGALVFATDDNYPVAHDRRTGNWFTDEAPGWGGVKAICAWQDTIAYADGGGVLVQTATPEPDRQPGSVEDAPVIYRITLHPIHPFGLGGHGLIHDMMITGENLGGRNASIFEVVVSLDGREALSLGEFTVDTEGEFSRKLALPQVPTGRIEIEIVVSPPDAGGAGVVLNQVDLLCEAEGGLRELPPGEMA